LNLINYEDSRAIYEQIAENYKTLILKGVLQPDEQMPSVRKLAMELSTNPNTVQRAYLELEREGYLYAVKGRGNFVSGKEGLREKKMEELKEKIREIFKEAREIGVDPKELVKEVEQDDKD